MRAFLGLGIIGFVAAASPACGSDSDDGGGGGTTMIGYWCNCNSYAAITTTLMLTMERQAAEEECGLGCPGPWKVAPALSLIGTPECDAFCAKADAPGCPGTTCSEDADFWCAIDIDSCEAAKRERLKCLAETASVECGANGWHMTTDCGSFDELCSP